MPPIRIHADDPIQAPTSDSTTAAKPSGITPQTASSASHQNPPPTRTTPASVPATTTASLDNPPAPQPGARPLPPTSTSAAPTSYSSDSPPAPQPGYTATVTTTETRLSGSPPQFNIPPPTDSQLAGRSTTTATTAEKPGPTTLNLGPAASPYQGAHSGGAVPAPTGQAQGQRTSLDHPPGYVQRPDYDGSNAGSQQQDHQRGEGSGSSEGGVGETAWNLLAKAGEALKKGEEAAWRAVRNK